MKKTIKKIAAVLGAVSIMGTATISASAATADDVVAAARAAGFLEEYVQTLQNYLRVTKFTSEQYDILVQKFGTVGSEMDEIALRYFGKTVEEMKNGAEKDAEENNTPVDDSFLNDIVDKMDGEDIAGILDEIKGAGDELGLDITVEQKGDKDFTLTIKDKEGNVQLVTPIGKLIDRTGVQITKTETAASTGMNTAAVAVFTAVTVLGIAGASVVVLKLKKEEE